MNSYISTRIGLKIIRNASTLSIHRMANTSNTEIIMTDTPIHLWNNLILIVHRIAAGTHVFQC